MENLTIFAVIAVFFTSLILGLGRIAGSNEFKESAPVAFLTIVNLFVAMFTALAALATQNELATSTPFIQMMVFSIVASIAATASALNRQNKSEDTVSAITDTSPSDDFRVVEPATVLQIAPEPLITATETAVKTATPVRPRTKPVIASSILESISDTTGGRLISTTEQVPAEELS